MTTSWADHIDEEETPQIAKAQKEEDGVEEEEEQEEQEDDQSQVCWYFQEGKCSWGSRCNFLHIMKDDKTGKKEEEEQTAAKSWRASGSDPQKQPSNYYNNRFNNYKKRPQRKGTELITCKYWLDGECQFNEDCIYLHKTQEELQAEKDDDEEEQDEKEEEEDQEEAADECWHWMQKGYCRLGSACKFFHDPNLKVEHHQQQERPKKEKTKECSFFVRGNCKYGTQCTFLHTQQQKPKEQEKQQPNEHHKLTGEAWREANAQQKKEGKIWRPGRHGASSSSAARLPLHQLVEGGIRPVGDVFPAAPSNYVALVVTEP
jgi:hypothetical protein